jgi:hypothetical protein
MCVGRGGRDCRDRPWHGHQVRSIPIEGVLYPDSSPTTPRFPVSELDVCLIRASQAVRSAHLKDDAVLARRRRRRGVIKMEAVTEYRWRSQWRSRGEFLDLTGGTRSERVRAEGAEVSPPDSILEQVQLYHGLSS